VSLFDVYAERKEYGYQDENFELYSLTIEDGVTAKTNRYNREFLVKGDKKKYKITKYHDLVFNPQNLRYGAIALNYNQCPILLSPIYATLYIKDQNKYDVEYFNFLLTSQEMINYYDSIAEGTLIERMTVKPKIFLKQEFNIPPIEEQRKISMMLIEMRNEISILEKELELKKLQKQGLMQQLLTGKIRVNIK
jgi:type I restriction enzyme S subunit